MGGIKKLGEQVVGTISFKNYRLKPEVVAHAFKPSTQEARQVDLCEFKISLVYMAIANQSCIVRTLSQGGEGGLERWFSS